MKKTSGSVGIGVLTDKFHIEGPIIKDQLSYSVSVRGLHGKIEAAPVKKTLLGRIRARLLKAAGRD